MAGTKFPKWQGRRIVKDTHAPEIEHAAAIYEFKHLLPRGEAERRAFDDYRKAHHQQAAAHHLRGMRAAGAAGDLDEASKHSTAYSLHLHALGHDPLEAVPSEIESLVNDEKRKSHYKFKAHNADALLLD